MESQVLHLYLLFLLFFFQKVAHDQTGYTSRIEENWMAIVFFIFKFVESMRLQN